MFNHLLIDAFNTTDKKTIIAGIAKSAAAKNNFVGLSNKLFPLISPSVFLGTYNSK